MKPFFAAVLALAILSGCSTGPTYMGYPVRQADFKVDAGKTVSLPVTRVGPLPAENDDYKIEVAGVSASLTNGKPAESKLNWGFGLTVKNSVELESVTVERVTETGALEPLVKDQTPTLKGNAWMARTAPVPMTREAVPWLYTKGDSAFIFKFTIRAKGGESTVFYQPSVISAGAKSMYLKIIAER